MPSTSMRRWTWNSEPTWMTLGTQYSSMLLNWEGRTGWVGAQHCLLRAVGFPGVWGTPLPRAELVLGENPLKLDCFCPSPLPTCKGEAAPRAAMPRDQQIPNRVLHRVLCTEQGQPPTPKL